MTKEVAIAFGAPFAFAMTALCCALALGKAVAAAMDATARQPEASGKILVNMLLGCALIEAISLYGLVFANGMVGLLKH
jgi:F-type H+-transporting ATPase subunit c